MHRLCFLLGCLGLITMVRGVCKIPTGSKDVPTDYFKDLTYHTFTVDIEEFDEDKNAVVGSKLYWSQDVQRVRVTSWANTSKSDTYFLYDDDEILHYQYPYASRGTCKVTQQISKSRETFFVGGTGKNRKGDFSTGDLTQLFHVAGVDAAGNTVKTWYVGKETVRGKDVDKFVSCQEWSFMNNGKLENTPATVTTYFRTKDTSWTYWKNFQVPIKIDVTGEMNNKVFHHVYSYFNLVAKIEPYKLETPQGVYCPNRKSKVAFPKLPKFFKWNLEIIDRKEVGHTYTEEIYDTIDHIAVIREQSKPGTFTNINRFLTVQNFLSGLSYRMDQVTGHCLVQNITDNNLRTKKVVDGKAVMDTVSTIFRTDQSNLTYMGKRMVRNMNADTWVGVADYDADGQAVVEWYFAPKNTKTMNDGLTSRAVYRVPLMVRIWPKLHSVDYKPTDDGKLPYMERERFRDHTVDWNIFNFDTTDILSEYVGIHDCLLTTRDSTFNILFRDAADTLQGINLESFKWRIRKAVAQAANVHWIRVNIMGIRRYKSNMVAIFYIFDRPPYAGDASIPDARTTTSLKDATENLKATVKDGSFTVTVTLLNPTIVNKDFTADPTFGLIPPWVKGTSEEQGPPGVPSVMAAMGQDDVSVFGMSGGDSDAADNGDDSVVGASSAEGSASKQSGKKDGGDGKYSHGALAGLGVAMLIVGLLVGGGLSFFLIAKKGMCK